MVAVTVLISMTDGVWTITTATTATLTVAATAAATATASTTTAATASTDSNNGVVEDGATVTCGRNFDVGFW